MIHRHCVAMLGPGRTLAREFLFSSGFSFFYNIHQLQVVGISKSFFFYEIFIYFSYITLTRCTLTHDFDFHVYKDHNISHEYPLFCSAHLSVTCKFITTRARSHIIFKRPYTCIISTYVRACVSLYELGAVACMYSYKC